MICSTAKLFRTLFRSAKANRNVGYSVEKEGKEVGDTGLELVS
jgi:hypothetical protein